MERSSQNKDALINSMNRPAKTTQTLAELVAKHTVPLHCCRY
ncbi:hypothetical protein NEIMUCOT_06184 [Neisseria mucosa ATCC 25996]|uniref:Uncharacterized protein n=1 Tax=Neisseria mucosa (strain ATCC 25996 / DSM 4631 / NCTC 10774 / M26) TaxID=546266 RepID=D2ZZV0_NEIM2|nr:hypothetical protein NEIMUCOT_06184 [Neisseria mucosa ATCC 25996]